MQHAPQLDDIEQTVERYSNGLLDATPLRKSLWKKMRMNHLDPRHEETPFLPEEEGFDGHPLVNGSPPWWRFTEEGWKYLPPLEDARRVTLFFHPGNPVAMVHQLIKTDWERRWVEHHAKESDTSLDFKELMTGTFMTPFDDMVRFDQVYACSLNLFQLCESSGNLATRAGYQQASFEVMVRELVDQRLHHCALYSQEFQDFKKRQDERLQRMAEGTPEEQERFTILRLQCLQAQEILDDLHLQVETQRLINKNQERHWFQVFGEEEVDIIREQTRRENLLRRVELKRNNPNLSWGGLQEAVKEEERKADKQMGLVEYLCAVSPGMEKRESGRWGTGDSSLMQKERALCKKLLRKIQRLIHPDLLAHNPSYGKLTEWQKEELARMLNESLEVDPAEIGYPPDHLNFDMRSSQGLQRVLRRIEIILETAGLKIDPDHVLPDAPLAQQLQWLQRELERLEDAQVSAMAALRALMTDPLHQRRRAILLDETSWPKVKQEMAGLAGQMRLESDRLELELRELFTDA